MIKLKNVSKNYDNKVALQQVSFTIREGICFGLIGPNGAGKSTLMKIIAGIIQKSQGEIFFNEKAIEKCRNEVKTMIGYVPQDIVLENLLTARDNLMFFGGTYKIPRKELKDKVSNMLAVIGLADRANESVKNFSGGMKRRLNIGCALIHDPTLIILDEPTVGIDPQSRNYIYSIIEKLKEEGKTIIYSSHYMEEVQNLCEEIVLLDHGSILENGSVNKIIDKYSKPSVFVEGEKIQKGDLRTFGEAKEFGGGYRVEGDDILNIIEQISGYLKNNNKTASRLEIYRINLEDIFLLLTGTNLRDK